jgi:hypothetical protein
MAALQPEPWLRALITNNNIPVAPAITSINKSSYPGIYFIFCFLLRHTPVCRYYHIRQCACFLFFVCNYIWYICHKFAICVYPLFLTLLLLLLPVLLVALNLLKAELNPICHLLALLGAHHIFHFSGLRVNML